MFADVSDGDVTRLGIDENTRTIARLLTSEAHLDAMQHMIPDEQTLTTSGAVRATDAEGWHSCRVAADMASLHNHAQVVGATTLRRVRRFLRRETDPASA